MDILKSYKMKLKEHNNYKFTNYQHKGYILPCSDENKETTHIYFEIYYSHCNYEIYLQGLNIKEIEENGTIEHFTSIKPIKLTMAYTSYKFSKKKMQEAIDFIFTNCNQLLQYFCEINKNISLN